MRFRCCGREIQIRLIDLIITDALFSASIKSWSCYRCGKRYMWRDSLKKHLRVECGKDPTFECPICGRKFKHKHRWQSHARLIHYINIWPANRLTNREAIDTRESSRWPYYVIPLGIRKTRSRNYFVNCVPLQKYTIIAKLREKKKLVELNWIQDTLNGLSGDINRRTIILVKVDQTDLVTCVPVKVTRDKFCYNNKIIFAFLIF